MTDKASNHRRVIALHKAGQLYSETIWHYPTASNRRLAICGLAMNEYNDDTTKQMALYRKGSICADCQTLDPTTPTYN